MKTLSNILLISCIIITSNAGAQEYNYYSFNELYNFDASTVYDIYQDPEANMWLGTNEGLVKFNGVDFTYYVLKGYDKSASNIKRDEQGRIWFSNFQGQLFYVEEEQIHLALDNVSEDRFILDYSVALPFIVYTNNEEKKLRKHNLLSGEENFLFNCENGGILAVDSRPDEIIFVHGYNDSVDDQERIWNFWSYTISTHKFVKLYAHKSILVSSKFGLLAKEESIYFWEVNDSLKLYKLDDEKFELILSETITAQTINQMDYLNGDLAILTKVGFQAISLTKKTLDHAQHFTDFSISHVFLDHEKNWWITTLNDGIKIVSNESFTHSKLAELEIDHSCLGDDGELYYTTINGDLYQTVPPYNTTNLICSNRLEIGEEIHFNAYNKILYLSSSDYYYDTKSDNFFRHSDAEYTAFGKSFFRKCLFLNEAEGIYCSYNIVNIFNQSGTRLSEEIFKYKGIDKTNRHYFTLKNVNAYHLAIEKGKDDFYIGYNEELFHYSYENTGAVLFNDANILTTSMIQANNSGVWLGTQDGQLLKIVEGEIIFSKQFPKNFTKIIEWENVLFLGDKNQIYRYDINTDIYSLIDQTDGLLNERIVDLYIHKDTLLILGENSLQKIPCSFASTNDIPPVLRIESIFLFDQQRELTDLDLQHNENNITIHFSATAIRSQKKYSYQYRLNEEDWIETDANAPFAQFPKLAPGLYNFEVRALNEDGIQSEIQKIQFFIDFHFTQKWWFILSVLFLIGLFIYWLIRNRLKQVRKQTKEALDRQQLKMEVNQSKIAALRAQMNPHFMFNALNSIQEFILTNQKEIASDYLADFADLMRKYLDQSRVDEISLSEEIETLKIYLSLESLRAHGKMKYSIECDSELDAYDINIPIMLLQPHIENAIKHGLMHKEGGKLLKIAFNKIGADYMECRIEDNGIGRQASEEINKARQFKPASFATNAIDQKIDLVNKNSWRNVSVEIIDLFDNEQCTGTRVIISLTI